MRIAKLTVAALLLAASPALAQSPSGNVSQPERTVPQAGTTTGGPLDNPSTRDMPPATGSTSRPVGENGMSAGAGAVDSAKGGNADQTNKGMGANTGSTSGGPAR
ncbi:hypothetical protein [Methylobacterium sp. WL19]|uniref:hypothetical protein n=1 Tax=Methylobacterium sp. WL19 TaxID=2603896 RepID=UPI0011C9EE20|nr:hypothetical protein [Methylobacterium sp. WL19]TXN28876.1 hypothetical protein FV220_08090 [Methylobacterium sp. WL19]